MGRKKGKKDEISNNKDKLLHYYCDVCGKKIIENEKHDCSEMKKANECIERLRQYVKEENKKYNR
jgi:predicted nucleic acid-binding Zn ribbon protein